MAIVVAFGAGMAFNHFGQPKQELANPYPIIYPESKDDKEVKRIPKIKVSENKAWSRT